MTPERTSRRHYAPPESMSVFEDGVRELCTALATAPSLVTWSPNSHARIVDGSVQS